MQALSLNQFAAAALDWPEVRSLVARQARSSLGRRALEELAPRDDADARAAHVRLRELFALLSSGEEPPLGGVTDPGPLPAASHEMWSRRQTFLCWAYQSTPSNVRLLDLPAVCSYHLARQRRHHFQSALSIMRGIRTRHLLRSQSWPSR